MQKMLTRIVERLKKGTLSEQIAEPKSMQYALLRRNVKPLDAPRPATSVPKPRKAAPVRHCAISLNSNRFLQVLPAAIPAREYFMEN